MIALPEKNNIFASLTGRIIGLTLVPIPFIFNKLISENGGSKSYLPSVQDLSVFTFNELVENVTVINKQAPAAHNRPCKNMHKEIIHYMLKNT
jgi:hypothetical protein